MKNVWQQTKMKRNKTNSNHLCKIIQTRCFSVFKIFKRYSLSSLCVRPGKLWAPFPPVINMRPGYMSLVEVRSHARPAICLKNGKPPLILASSLQPRERKPCQLSPECCSNADLTSMSPSRRKKVTQFTWRLFVFLQCSFSAWTSSLHRTAAAAGLDTGPANVQPWKLGTVFKELLDGDVTHVQLRRQRVFFLHGHGKLLEDLCGRRERENQRFYSPTRSTYAQINKRLLKEYRADKNASA